jgi:hypothetical protein
MGLFGDGGSKATSIKPLDEAMFKNYGYTGLTGTTTGTRDDDGGFQFTTTMSPELQNLYKTAETKANPFLSQYLTELQDPVARFDYQSEDPSQRESKIFQEQSALLRPELARQQIEARDRMFAGGRMGLLMGQEGAGAGEGNAQINPDAYALNLAQSRAIAELAPQARQMAQDERQAEFNRQQQRYILGAAADQQRLTNLLGGYQTAFSGISDIYGLESSLLGQSAGLEQARANAVYDASLAAKALYIPASGGGGGLFGSALGGAFGEIGSAAGEVVGDYGKEAIKNYFSSQTGGTTA